MFISVEIVVSNKDFLLDFLVIKLLPLFVRYIYKHKTFKYLNVVKVLTLIDLSFFRYQFPMTYTSYKEPILKIIGSFHCFSPEIMRRPTVNKHCIFYGDDSFLFLFS